MSGPPHTFALIPAAGKSTRMGQPKLALSLGKRTVLERVIDALKAAQVEIILVVVGPNGRNIAALAQSAGADTMVLSEETPDMRSTVQSSLEWLQQACQPADDDCWLLVPGDHPLLDPAVIHELFRTERHHPEASIFIPTFEGKRGHPVLIRWRHVAGIRTLPANQGLNTYFRQHAAETMELPVASPDILCDLDTPEDYERLLQRWHDLQDQRTTM